MAMGQAQQNPDLPRLAISPLFNRVAGQVEVPAGQVNLRGSLPRSENNVLQPMLQPARARMPSIVLASRVSGHFLDTQTLKYHPS